ncbi:MAG: hypothetical protein M5U19_14625 [Microthrixaceae bacterium]|nr:hypothetical protein [Microthrixaceae bacterium]
MLSFEEIDRIAAVMVNRFGIDSIRPHRRGADGACAPGASDLQVGGTSGGPVHDDQRIELAAAARDLRAAGLDRVNISLDS